MKRGAPRSALPEGVRQDTRKHTKHILRPDAAHVHELLADPTPAAHARFRERYRATIRARMKADRTAYDALAELAASEHVWLGCSCPTSKVPDVRNCHTWLALELMREAYPELDVRLPKIEP